MIGDIKICARDGCNEEYVARTHNQKYHDAECCRLATNAKIMQKYYDRRAQRLGHKRYCKKCDSKLSRYNSADMCNTCAQISETTRNNSTKQMISSVLVS